MENPRKCLAYFVLIENLQLGHFMVKLTRLLVLILTGNEHRITGMQQAQLSEAIWRLAVKLFAGSGYASHRRSAI